MNASPDSARADSGLAFLIFGRLLPGTFFLFLVAVQVQLLAPELSTAFANAADIGAATLILNRVVFLTFAGGVALIYVARKPPALGRRDPFSFIVAMYASFVLLAFRPIAAGFKIPLGVNSSATALVVSNILLISGLAISAYSLAYLRFNFSILPEARALVSGGPYRWVRHPIYLGEIISGAGIVLLLPTWIPVLVLGSFIAAQLIRTRIEEATLTRAIPGYSEYARRTRHRLIPGVI